MQQRLRNSHAERETAFREMCHSNGLAATHQRAVIYDEIMNWSGHPSPEEIYSRVKKKIPAISLATVYKALHAFLESGIVRKVSVHSGTLLIESNPEPHHHLVCTSCRNIVDIAYDAIGQVEIKPGVPKGFRVQRCSVEVLGICERCAAKAVRRMSHQTHGPRLQPSS